MSNSSRHSYLHAQSCLTAQSTPELWLDMAHSCVTRCELRAAKRKAVGLLHVPHRRRTFDDQTEK